MTVDLVTRRVDEIGCTFSTTKIFLVHFCRLNKKHDIPDQFLDGTRLEYKRTVRFLSLVYGSKLRWKSHISVVRRCKKDINIVKERDT